MKTQSIAIDLLFMYFFFPMYCQVLKKLVISSCSQFLTATWLCCRLNGSHLPSFLIFFFLECKGKNIAHNASASCSNTVNVLWRQASFVPSSMFAWDLDAECSYRDNEHVTWKSSWFAYDLSYWAVQCQEWTLWHSSKCLSFMVA